MIKMINKIKISFLGFCLFLLVLVPCVFSEDYDSKSTLNVVYGWCGDGACSGPETGSNCAADCYVNVTVYVATTVTRTSTKTEFITVSNVTAKPLSKFLEEIFGPDFILKKYAPKILAAPEYEKPAFQPAVLISAGFIKTGLILGVLAAAFAAGLLINVGKIVTKGISGELQVKNKIWPLKKEITEMVVVADVEKIPHQASFVIGDKKIPFKMMSGSPRNIFREALTSGPIMMRQGNRLIFIVKDKKKDFVDLFYGDEFKIICAGISPDNSKIYYLAKKHSLDVDMQKKLWKMLEPKTSDTKEYFKELESAAAKANIKGADDLKKYVSNINSILQ